MTIGPFHTGDHVNDQLRADHIAGGQPRYSNTLYLLSGGFVRRWTDDRDEALARHARSVADKNLRWTITFDHVAIEDVAVHFLPHCKTAEQLKTECDEALDAMMERWAQDDRR